MNASWSSDRETDLQLVEAVAALDPKLARKVQRRLRLLRLRRIINPAPVETRHSIWHSLRWPWARRG